MGKIVLLFAIVLVFWGGPVPAGIAEEAPHGAVTSTHEGEASEPNLFSGSIADSLWTVVAFATLVLVLGVVAWKPLLKALDARQNHIEQQIKSAEESRRRAERMLEDYQVQGRDTVRKATEEAQRHHQETVEQTREEVLTLRRRAHEEIESARAAAMDELWKQTGDILLRLGSQVLGRVVSPQDNQRLIDEAVTQIRRNGGL
jgi:F-type H+-transporting ATPase subunit b